MIKHPCESCIHGEVQIVPITKYRNYPYGVYETKVLSTWCKLKWQYKRWLVTRCKDYMLKPDYIVKVKINGKTKRVEQKTLWSDQKLKI